MYAIRSYYANRIKSVTVKIICHAGISVKAALNGKLTGAVSGKRLSPMDKGLLGDSINAAVNQNGATIGRVNNPEICWASLLSVTVAPKAAIMAAIITKAGKKVMIIRPKKERSICAARISGIKDCKATTPSKPNKIQMMI